jgi:hypothetical protein
MNCKERIGESQSVSPRQKEYSVCNQQRLVNKVRHLFAKNEQYKAVRHGNNNLQVNPLCYSRHYKCLSLSQNSARQAKTTTQYHTVAYLSASHTASCASSRLYNSTTWQRFLVADLKKILMTS